MKCVQFMFKWKISGHFSATSKLNMTTSNLVLCVEKKSDRRIIPKMQTITVSNRIPAQSLIECEIVLDAKRLQIFQNVAWLKIPRVNQRIVAIFIRFQWKAPNSWKMRIMRCQELWVNYEWVGKNKCRSTKRKKDAYATAFFIFFLCIRSICWSSMLLEQQLL